MIKYGYDSHYQRGYYIPDNVPNILSNRMYIHSYAGGWQLYRYSYEGMKAVNTVLLDEKVGTKRELRKAAENVSISQG